jgi:hypothetical protein
MSNVKIQCEGITKQKKRCTKNASEGSVYCWQHKENSVSLKEEKNIIPLEEKKPTEIPIKIPNDVKSLISTPKKINTGEILILGDIQTKANIYGDTKDFDYHTDVKTTEIYATGSFNLSLPIGENESNSIIIKFNENRNYTLKEILDKIVQEYRKEFTSSEMETFINSLEEGNPNTETYYDLQMDLDENLLVRRSDMNLDKIKIKGFKKDDSDGAAENQYVLELSL